MQKYKIDPTKTSYYYCTCTVVEWLCIFKLEADNENIFLYHLKRAAEKQEGNIKIWQNEYHPVALFSQKWFNEKLNYTHYNPVRKGYVLKSEDWKYTTARNWHNGEDEVISLDLEQL